MKRGRVGVYKDLLNNYFFVMQRPRGLKAMGSMETDSE